MYRKVMKSMQGQTKVIAVAGKGGVGKSLVTSLLAVEMAKKGYKTAILDADITGPSIPKIFGIHARPESAEEGLKPVVSSKNIKIMSTNLILERETDPVVWRGPVIANMVKQFWSEVYWGEIDYMFVDMPPGTGDVPLTVYQSLPVNSIVIVASPQELVQMIQKKYENTEVQVTAIHNDFFGEQITVAGLLTGQDLIAQLKDKIAGDRLLLSEHMLKSGERVFLDDVTVEDLEKTLQIKISIVESSGNDFVHAIVE